MITIGFNNAELNENVKKWMEFVLFVNINHFMIFEMALKSSVPDI